MADRITNSTLIKKTQIQQKTADGLIGIRPETDTSLVVNNGTNITGDTVEDIFESAKPIRSSDGSISISLANGYLDFVVASAPVTITLNGSATSNPSFYAPTTAGTSGYILKSNGSGAPTWIAPSTLNVGSALQISDGSITYTPATLQAKLAGLSAYLGTASTLKTLTGTTADAGDFFRVTGSFTVNSDTAHVGDIVILKTGATSSAEANWEVIHTGDNTNTTYTLKAGSTANIVQLWADGASSATSSITVNNVANASKVSNKVTFNNSGSGAASGSTYDGSSALTVSYNTLGISATTTSVTVGSTTFNKYVHPTTAGNKHIPSGGAANQLLGWSAAGTAQWVSSGVTAGTYSAVLVNAYGLVTAGSQVIGYYSKTQTIGNELATGGFAFVEV